MCLTYEWRDAILWSRRLTEQEMNRLRQSAQLTQEELAKKLGVQRSTVAMWETGQAYPRPDKLLKLEELLGVPAGDIIRAINEAKQKSAQD